MLPFFSHLRAEQFHSLNELWQVNDDSTVIDIPIVFIHFPFLLLFLQLLAFPISLNQSYLMLLRYLLEVYH
jgi:hypothetical protein